MAQLYDLVMRAIQQGTTSDAEQRLAELSRTDDPPQFTALLSKLQAILRGDCTPALADDPDLVYGDAVELQLMLEELGRGKIMYSIDSADDPTPTATPS